MTTPRLGPVWFMTPGTRPDRYAAATTFGADVALVDLEDSVAPDAKEQARQDAWRFFDRPEAGSCTLGIRVNALGTLDGVKDLAAIAAYRHQPAVVLIPKTESARDVAMVAGILDTVVYNPFLFALIETPRAIADLPAIVAAPRLAGAVFGSADYAALLGTGTATNWEPMLHARHTVANVCSAAGLLAIDTPFFAIDDPDGLREEAQRAKAIGFHGKGAIHPRQIATITAVFQPSAAEIAEARAIVAAAEHSARHITSVNGQMRGRPFFAKARALLDRLGEQTAQEQQARQEQAR
ncbi:HpcH/HpaI aldolase/citrate lyase family protein [Kitasatospora sp. NPDC087861]|uniref:HpcH/HpaI aldolase/citrate lyase family protein n=1 Tax=Kitasatospora sp. NPDC087861 TaxID=3364070 RepID=UPI003825B6CC